MEKKTGLEYLPKHIVHRVLMGKDSLAVVVVVAVVVVKDELEIYIVVVHSVVALKKVMEYQLHVEKVFDLSPSLMSVVVAVAHVMVVVVVDDE